MEKEKNNGTVTAITLGILFGGLTTAIILTTSSFPYSKINAPTIESRTAIFRGIKPKGDIRLADFKRVCDDAELRVCYERTTSTGGTTATAKNEEGTLFATYTEGTFMVEGKGGWVAGPEGDSYVATYTNDTTEIEIYGSAEEAENVGKIIEKIKEVIAISG